MAFVFMNKKGLCELPDGRMVTCTDADLEGYDVLDAAELATLEKPTPSAAAGTVPNGHIAFEIEAGVFASPNGDRMGLVQAEQAGFHAVTRREVAAIEKAAGVTAKAPAPARLPQPAPAFTDAQKAVLSLPEAALRPRAAMRFVALETSKGMSLAEAARFLRGLPEETEANLVREGGEVARSPRKAIPGRGNMMARRKIEIAAAACDLKAARGDASARTEAKALNYALKLMGTGTSIEAACQTAGVNLTKYL